MRFLFLVASAVFFTNEADKNRPVTKVITLLKNMQKKLEKEGEDDQEIYDHMACWCKTNDREKTDAIKEAEQAIDQLTARIEELTARSSRLNTEIENLNEEVAKNQDALDKAIKLRGKQHAEFTAEEKDMLEAIQALKSAITVLSKHHGSLLQESDLMTLAASIHRQITRFPDMISDAVTPSERRALNDFMQAPGYESYNSQSGQIFGILKNMNENFQNNLLEAQKEEQQRQSVFEELKASKEEEIAAGNAQIDKKTQQKADADNDNSEAKQELEDTRNSLSADEQFLMSLKEKCLMTDKEWERRQKSRQEEIAAVGKALEILSKDDAHDTFTKTFNKSFLQMSEVNARDSAARVLARAAKKFSSPQLSHLANKVRLDVFTRVKAAIDQMVTELLRKKEDEVKHQDWCTEALHYNARITSSRDRDRSDTETTIENLKAKIHTLAKRIDLLNNEMSEIRVQLKRAGEDRQTENSEFQQTVADQRQTQQLLQQALTVLSNIYAPKGESLAQKDEPAGPPPPEGFKEYKKSAAAGGVLSFLRQIIQDAKAMEAEAIQDETDAQEAYEQLVKESNQSVEEKTKARVNAEKTKGETEQYVVESEQRLDGLNVELSQLSNEKADAHKSCDFTLKNFDVRQQARDEEVAALRQAKAILSGSKFSEFLHRGD